MVANALLEVLYLVFRGFHRLARFGCRGRAKRRSSNQQFRSLVAAAEHKHFVSRVICCSADDMDAKSLEQLARRIEKRRRVVVASDDDDMTAAGLRDLAEEIVVQLLGGDAGEAGVEDISSHQQDVNLPVVDFLQQPLQKGQVFVMPFLNVQRPPQVPVGSVQYFHKSSLSMVW